MTNSDKVRKNNSTGFIIYFLEEIETCCCFREATPFEVMGKGSEHNDLIAYGPHREPAVSSVAESPQLID